jgi:ornithine cyclodeaminase/alanine dehydrogenase-like protein (mu-crystallin family)
MTLLLSNEEIESIVEMPACIDALERAYGELAARRAVNRPRSDVFGPHPAQNAYFLFKTFEGLLPSDGVVALRINSNIKTWTRHGERLQRDKLPLAGGRWVGLVMLFSTETGEPLAIFPDGVVQRMRVGGTNALGSRYLAREDASVYGLLGSGWQAGAQLMGMAAIRPLREIRVFSRDADRRQAFASEFSSRLGIDVRAVDTARAAVEGADIVGTATNAIGPLVDSAWLSPGVHLTCVKRSELGDELLASCDRVVVHQRDEEPLNYLVGAGDRGFPAHDPVHLLEMMKRGEPIPDEEIERARLAHPPSAPDVVELADLVSGRAPGRQSAQERTAFVNNTGLGLQFAAVGAAVYRRARELGVGRELPTEWFTEDVHS